MVTIKAVWQSGGVVKEHQIVRQPGEANASMSHRVGDELVARWENGEAPDMGGSQARPVRIVWENHLDVQPQEGSNFYDLADTLRLELDEAWEDDSPGPEQP